MEIKRKIIIGDFITKIENLTDEIELFRWGTHYETPRCDLTLSVKSTDEICIPNYLCKLNNDYQGMANNVYYTLYNNYGVRAKSDLNKNVFELGFSIDKYSAKSYYFIRSIINRHICRFIFKSNVPLHSGCVINKKGYAIMFMGAPGAGKSSFVDAFIRNGCRLSNDDTIIYDNESKTVSGFSEGLYFRPDALGHYREKYPQNMITEIAPGRKYFVANERPQICKNKVLCVVLLDRNFNNAFNCNFSYKDAHIIFEQAHQGWCKNIQEEQKLLDAFGRMSVQYPLFYSNLEHINDTINWFKENNYL